jgi:localization factor PodJL
MRGLEDRLEAIVGRLDAGARQTADIDPQLIEGLERQLAGLTAQLSRPAPAEPARDDLSPRLERIEQSLADQRDAIVAAAQEAADRAVSSMRANGIDDEDVTALAEELATLESLARRSDERNARTFEAIHDTLLKVVDRLGSIEARSADLATAHRSRIETAHVPPMAPRNEELPMAASPVALATSPAVAAAMPAAPRPQPQRSAAEAAAAAAAAAFESPAEDDEAVAPKKSLLGGLTRAFSGRKETRTESPAREEPAAPLMAEVGLDEPLEGAVVDQPLEPGSGAPDLNAIMKRVRDERGATPQRPDTGAAGKADFIAAARRAAQAAAAEAQTFRQASGPEGATRKFSPSEFLRAKRKPILMAATAIMIALAGLQLGKAFFGDDPRQAAETPAPAASSSLVARASETAQPDAALEEPASPGPVRVVDGADETAEIGRQAMEPAEAGDADEAMPATMSGPTAAADETEMSGDAAVEMAALPQDAGTDEIDAEDAAGAIAFEAAPTEAGPLALREAADAGDPKAMFEIGNRYDAGRGLPSDRAAAARWYERAAEQGFAPAQYRIGNFYEKGIGVERDTSKAKTWYQLAAAQGNASAMHNLAVLFAVGSDGTVDNESAGRWFVKAAELGVKDSQYNLGILAAKGLGVPQNLEESYKWFALVAQSGDKDAAAKRDEVAKALRPEQLTRARATTELWKPKPLDEDANLVEIPAEWQESAGATASVDMKKAVATIQMILNKNGYDAGVADGIMGQRTRSAIMAFQTDNGLSPTGEVDDGLVRLLLAKK